MFTGNAFRMHQLLLICSLVWPETCLGAPSFLLKESEPQARRLDQFRFERETGKLSEPLVPGPPLHNLLRNKRGISRKCATIAPRRI